MAADLGRLVATLEARAEKFDLTLERAVRRLDTLASQTERANHRMAQSSARLESALAGVGRGFKLLAGAVSLVAIERFVAGQIKALDALGALAQQTGLSATALRQLQVGLELNGGTAEQASEGLLTFSKNLGQVEAGTGRLTGLLKKLDPTFLASLRNAGNTGDALKLIADRIAGARSEQEKLAIATAAFGDAGRQFVLLLADGAKGLEALQAQLAGLGINNLEQVTAAAQRFDAQMKKLTGTVTTQFQKGLFGIGEGLDSITDALDDNAIRRLGKMAEEAGELTAALAKLFAVTATPIAQSFLEFMNSLAKGEGLGVASARSEQDVGKLADGLGRVRSELSAAKADLDRIIALPPSERAAKAALPRIISEVARLTALEKALREEVAEGRSFAPVTGVGHARSAVTPNSSIAPGEKAPDAAIAKAHDSLLRQHEQFVASMRQASAGALTEAQQLSLKLAETLGKIGQAPGLDLAEKTRLQTEAIGAAAEAITKAETDALAKQNEQVSDFLAQFGADTVSNAEKLAEQVRDALDKIPGLSAEQKAALEAAAQPRIQRVQQAEQGGVQRELLQRAATIQADSFAGLSKQTEQALAEMDARLAASDLDEKIAKAFSADPARVAELQAENQQLLDDQLANISSSWDETLTEIGAFGEQAFADMVQGWIQGADVSFDGILKSFAALLAKMAAEAAAKDIFAAVKDSGAGDFLSGLLDSGSAAGDTAGAAATAAGAAELTAASTTSATLLGTALTTGSAELLTASTSAAAELTAASAAMVTAAAAISASAAALEAAAAAAAASSAVALVAEGGVATSRGMVRLERIHALAQGGYVAPRLDRLDRFMQGPTIALAEGGMVASNKTERIYRELVDGKESEKTRELVRSLSKTERRELVERIESTDSTTTRERIEGKLERILSKTERRTDRTDRTIEKFTDRGPASGSVRALVGEAGTERLLSIEKVREIALKSRGDPVKAAQLAQQIGVKLDHPEIRDLAPGDIVIPDRKLQGFFQRITPKARAAEGGLSSLQSVAPISKAVSQSTEGGASEFNLTIVNESGTQLGVKRKQVRQSGRRIDALMVVGQAGASDVRTGGEMSREMQRSFGVRVAPRET